MVLVWYIYWFEMDWKLDRRSYALEYFNLLTPPEGALFDRVGSDSSSSSQPCLLYLKLLFGKKMYIDYGTDTVDIIKCIALCTDYLTGLSGFNISTNLLSIRIARTQMGTHIQWKKRLGRRHNLDGKIWISIRCKCLTFFCVAPAKSVCCVLVHHLFCRFVSRVLYASHMCIHFVCLFYS